MKRWAMIQATVMSPHPEPSFEGKHMSDDPDGEWYKVSDVNRHISELNSKIRFLQSQVTVLSMGNL